MTLEMFNFSQFKLKNLNKDKVKTKQKTFYFATLNIFLLNNLSYIITELLATQKKEIHLSIL